MDKKKITKRKASKKNLIKIINKKGFTLVELLVIITILAIISSVSIYGISSILEKTRKRTYEVTINNIETAAANYLTENSDKLLFIDNNTEEYQCIQVQNLVDMGYFDNDITNSKVSSDETVGLEDYIYIARDITTKTVTKTIYLDENYANYNTVCSLSLTSQTNGNIKFTVNPTGWSKTKDITIYYNIKNTLNSSKYHNNYYYTNTSGKTIQTAEDVGNSITINVKENGTIYASNELISASKLITKIDNIIPVITTEYNGNNKRISTKLIIPLTITDKESGLNKESFTINDINIFVGGKEITNTNDDNPNKQLIYKSSSNGEYLYNIVINNKTLSGEVEIKINENTIFDNVGNGNETFTFKPNVIFDNTKPTCTISGNPSNWTNNDVVLTVSGEDEDGILSNTPYSWSNESGEYSTNNTKTISKNDTYVAYIKDEAGNIGSCSVTVTKIDKDPPTLVANNTSNGNEYTGSWTNKNIETVLTFSDSGSGIDPSSLKYHDNSNQTSWKKLNNTSTSTYKDTWKGEGNRIGYYKICDNVNNCTEISFDVKIDKTSPTISFSKLTRYAVKFTCSDSGGSNIRTINGWYKDTKRDFGFVGTRSTLSDCYDLGDGETSKIECVDGAGNSTTKTYENYYGDWEDTRYCSSFGY